MTDLRAAAADLAAGRSDAAAALAAVEGDATALAWALKDLCYARWNAEPAEAAAAAAALQALDAALKDGSAAVAVDASTEHAAEVAALADWTAGLARVIRGQMAAAVEAFDRAAAGWQRLGRPALAAQTQVPKVMALTMLGRHDAAAACGAATQRAFVEAGDWRAAGKVSLNLGSLQMRRDDYAQAVTCYRDAAVQFARVGDHEHSAMADIGMADARTALGEFDEALHGYRRAEARAARRGLAVVAAIAVESTALLELVRGRYREALQGLEASRRRYEALAMPQHLAIAEKQLADAYLALRLLPEALALYDAAVPRLEALEMPDDHAWALVQRGRALGRLGRADEARASWAAAAAAFVREGHAVGAATVALAQAEAALPLADGAVASPERLAEAAARAAEAERAFVAAGQLDGALRAAVTGAEVQLAAGGADDGQGVLSAALRRTLDAARTLGLLPVEVRCLTGLGVLAERSGDVSAASTAYQAAVDRFEDQRRALPGDELRSAAAGDHLQPYRGLLRLALAAHEAARPEARDARARAVLAALDCMRARTLADRLGAQHDATASGLRGERAGPSERDTEADRRARLHWLYRRTQRLDGGEAAPAALHDEMHRLERELLEAARRQRLAAAAPADAGALPALAPDAALGALQQRLGPEDGVVVYGCADDELFACVVRRDSLSVERRLARWHEVLDALRGARFQLDALRHGTAPVARHLGMLSTRTRQRLAALHAQVWAPLAGRVASLQRLVVVPHGPLATVPFAALDDGDGPIGRRHQFALAPSVALLAHGLARPAQVAGEAPAALVVGDSLHLPHAAAEAEAVAALFERPVLLLGEDATRAGVESAAAGADLIHLACHGQFRQDNPWFSSLALADGPLTVERVEQLRLRPGLVVLGACETALAAQAADGGDGGGDEMFGLVRGFLAAGAARVLASLWPVDDAVTATFMAPFHGALRGGATPAAALQQAQAETRERHPHPAHWAAFVLQGGW